MLSKTEVGLVLAGQVPVYRVVMGLRNCLFEDARSRDIVVMPEAPDTERLLAEGDEDELMRFYADNLDLRYGVEAPGWQRIYLNNTKRFRAPGPIVFTTRHKGSVWWCLVDGPVSFDPPGDAYGHGITMDMARRTCVRPWSNVTLGGVSLRLDELHPAVQSSVMFIRNIQSQMNDDYADYMRALLADQNVEPWHGRPEWRRRAIEAQSTRASAGSTADDFLARFRAEEDLPISYWRSNDTAGFVYGMCIDDLPGYVKIGCARDVEMRRAELQIGVPTHLRVLFALPAADKELSERYAHHLLRHDHFRGEWYRTNPETARRNVEMAIGAMDTRVKQMREAVPAC